MKKRFFRFPLSRYSDILENSYRLYLRKKHKLSQWEKNQLESALRRLQEAIKKRNRKEAKLAATALSSLTKELLPKTLFERMRELVVILAVTLALAVLIRQMWFELYEIPTGSMRPTLREKDRLVVSKTAFGLNIPLKTDHLYFSPDLVKRGGIITFTGENMDIPNTDTKYFFLFPGKKQYVKRIMGKPGDSVYFYGGMVYGIDKDGNDISHELQQNKPKDIDHIPFLHFNGKSVTSAYPVNGVYQSVRIKQMNETLAKLSVTSANQLQGHLVVPKHSQVEDYNTLWGMKNYGKCLILTKEEARRFTGETEESLPDAEYFLEIKHHPSLYNLILSQDTAGRVRPMFNLSSALIPLDEDHLRTLFQNLYTVRFVVKNGTAYQYGLPATLLQSPFLPKLPEVPDGTYEFYHGKAYKVSFEGILKELDSSHPLYAFSPERVQMWYNLGMEFDTRYSPLGKHSPFLPMRYAYFKDGDLYTMGSPIFEKDDPVLEEFIEHELKREKAAPDSFPYKPFIDQGAPILADGSLDAELIKTFGLKIPEKMYLALGDNHAVSADSRDFGFVPEENLRGAPDFVFWPPGNRFGNPNTHHYPMVTFPRVVIWLIVLIILAGSFVWKKRRGPPPPL